jgi:MFS family permease
MMQNVGAAWLMVELTNGQPQQQLLVSLLQSAATLPILLFSLPAGAFADIFDRKKLLIVVTVLSFLSAAALTLAYWFHLITPGWLLFFTFLIGTGLALYGPAWLASTTELVPDDDLPEAVTLNGISYNLARAIGPAIAGIIISWFGNSMVFLLNAISFMVMIPPLLLWHRPALTSVMPVERFWGSVRAGFRYAHYAKQLHKIFAHAVAFFICASSLWALLPLLARYQFHQDAKGYGIMLGTFGVGSLVTAFILPHIRLQFSRNQICFFFSVVHAISGIGVALTHNFTVANIFLLFAGASWIAVVSTLHVSTQQSAHDWVKARAIAGYLMIVFGSVSVGSFLWGLLASALTTHGALLIAMILLILSAAILTRVKLPTLTRKELEASHHWPGVDFGLYTSYQQQPVLISIEYFVEKEHQKSFLKGLKNYETVRRRDGAIHWQVYQDLADDRKITEQFIVETLVEHMRQHDRVSFSDLELEKAYLKYHGGDHPPIITHNLII